MSLFVFESLKYYDIWYDNTPGALDKPQVGIGHALIFKNLPGSDDFNYGLTCQRLSGGVI